MHTQTERSFDIFSFLLVTEETLFVPPHKTRKREDIANEEGKMLWQIKIQLRCAFYVESIRYTFNEYSYHSVFISEYWKML